MRAAIIFGTRPELLGRFGKLVGCNQSKIRKEAEMLIKNYEKVKERISSLPSPYGDGKASERIVKILEERLS